MLDTAVDITKIFKADNPLDNPQLESVEGPSSIGQGKNLRATLSMVMQYLCTVDTHSPEVVLA